MNTPRSRSLTLLAVLAIVMVITRSHHFGSHLSLPDASWALLFLAGFYLRGQFRWAFPLLMLEAVAIDYCAIRYFGVSNYCVTPAYWFILPAYAALWTGGAWFRQHYAMNLRAAGLLLLSLFVANNVCYLLTNGGFYWLGGRVTDPSLSGWTHNFSLWYSHFTAVTFAYVAIAAVLHLLVLQLRRTLAGTSTTRTST